MKAWALAAMLMAAVPARAETVLHVAYADDVSTFDPDNAFLLYGLDALRVIYQGLVQYKPGTTELTGWLAESWTLSEDRRTYTFTLYDGVRFQDGRTLTSADVLAYFRRRQSPDLALSYFLDGVTEMAAPDPRTFVITLAAPQPAFLDRLASPWGPKVIGPEALVDHEAGDHGEAWLNDHADGSGPYRLAEVNRGQRYVLTRNRDYWGKAPYFDRIEISVIPEMGQQMLLLKQGGLDLIQHGYPFEELKHLPPDLTLATFDDLGLEIAYTNQSKRLKDAALRQAVLTALNPAGWLQDAFAGFAVPGRSLYPRAMIAAPDRIVFPTDLDAARRIVAAAGPVSLEIGYSDAETAVQQHPADLIASALEQIGIHATVRSVPLDQSTLMANELANAPDIWLAQDYPDAAHPATQAGVFFTTGAPLNLFGYSDRAVDGLIDRASLVTDPAERDRQFLEASRRLVDSVAFVPLADIKDVIVYRRGLTDLDPRPSLPWSVDYETIRRE